MDLTYVTVHFVTKIRNFESKGMDRGTNRVRLRVLALETRQAGSPKAALCEWKVGDDVYLGTDQFDFASNRRKSP
jgi:hypothetical protein